MSLSPPELWKMYFSDKIVGEDKKTQIEAAEERKLTLVACVHFPVNPSIREGLSISVQVQPIKQNAIKNKTKKE